MNDRHEMTKQQSLYSFPMTLQPTIHGHFSYGIFLLVINLCTDTCWCVNQGW